MGKQQKLILVRGLPGTGKSTSGEGLVQHGYADVHLEADMYFVGDDGVFNYRQGEIGRAHAWCKEQTNLHLHAGKTVVVTNTFVRRWEMQFYLDLARKLRIPVEISTRKVVFKNTKNVPERIMEKMRQNWED